MNDTRALSAWISSWEEKLPGFLAESSDFELGATLGMITQGDHLPAVRPGIVTDEQGRRIRTLTQAITDQMKRRLAARN